MNIIPFVDSYSTIQKVYNPVTRQTSGRWIMSLPGAGCAWAKQFGGCYMCGFKYATNKYTRGRRLPASLYILLAQIAWRRIKKEEPTELWIYNGGNFLNDEEIPVSFQHWICSRIRESKINRLLVESRPEYINYERLSILNSIIGGKKLMIGIGLECENDDIRKTCINKGFLREDFEKAVDIAKRANVEVLTYVFLKPINLSEKASIEQAVDTIKYAFKKGSNLVALEAAIVQEETMMAEQYKKSEFRPPWLWSVMEVIERARSFGHIYLGRFEDNPPPVAIPYNCEKCSEEIMELLQKYRETNNAELLSKINCDCKEIWSKETKLV